MPALRLRNVTFLLRSSTMGAIEILRLPMMLVVVCYNCRSLER